MARSKREAENNATIILEGQTAAAERFVKETTWPDGNPRAWDAKREHVGFFEEGIEAAKVARYGGDEAVIFALAYATLMRTYYRGDNYGYGLLGRRDAAKAFLERPMVFLGPLKELREWAQKFADFAVSRLELGYQGWDPRPAAREEYLKAFGEVAYFGYPQRQAQSFSDLGRRPVFVEDLNRG